MASKNSICVALIITFLGLALALKTNAQVIQSNYFGSRNKGGRVLLQVVESNDIAAGSETESSDLFLRGRRALLQVVESTNVGSETQSSKSEVAGKRGLLQVVEWENIASGNKPWSTNKFGGRAMLQVVESNNGFENELPKIWALKVGGRALLQVVESSTGKDDGYLS